MCSSLCPAMIAVRQAGIKFTALERASNCWVNIEVPPTYGWFGDMVTVELSSPCCWTRQSPASHCSGLVNSLYSIYDEYCHFKCIVVGMLQSESAGWCKSRMTRHCLEYLTFHRKHQKHFLYWNFQLPTLAPPLMIHCWCYCNYDYFYYYHVQLSPPNYFFLFLLLLLFHSFTTTSTFSFSSATLVICKTVA